MEKIFIYGDEFGTHSLNEEDPQFISHFIYTAFAIKESNLQNAIDLRNELSSKYLFGQKLKSSSKALNNKNNFDKRLGIIKAICSLECAIYCLIVDKQSIDSEGLKFKETFYKFFQRIFLEQLGYNYNNYSIFMHNIINGRFALEMRDYLQSRNPSTLFNSYSYRMCTDEEEPLIQFADVLSGSLGRIFSISHKHPRWEELYNVISSKLIKPIIFPTSSKHNVFYDNNENDEKIDEEIFKIVQEDGEKFLTTNKDSIIKCIDEHLLFYQKIAPFKLVEIHELVSVINKNIGIEISQEHLRKCIRDIRYEGIMVVSIAGKSGYKLATSKNDVIDYFSHYLKYVVPMLQIVEIANNIFKGKTTGNFIPLNDSEVIILRKIIDNINKPYID